MKSRTRVVFGVPALLLLCYAPWLPAQPVTNRILDDVRVQSGDKTADIEVHFTFPVRYVTHFPEKSGDTLQIQLQPIAISAVDRLAVHRRESSRLPRHSGLPLLDISYEGDLAGGPYLTIRFLEPVQFTVHQDTDFRTISVHVSMEGQSTEDMPSTTIPAPVTEGGETKSED